MNPEQVSAVAPRPSTTVVLLRDAAAGPETLLVLRHADASFGASYVFPGGVNEPVDQEVGAHAGGADDALLSRRLGLAACGLACFSAAIRELVEETGVLLARRAGAAELIADCDFDALRGPLNAGHLSWAELLQRESLTLACDRLHYFAWWVTPRVFGRRYATRFFAARSPAGQQACHDGDELTDSCWLTPAAALAAAVSDEITLPPPTRATLEQLRRFQGVQAALAWADREEARGVDCILPAVLQDGGRQRIVMPGSADYPADHRGCEQ